MIKFGITERGPEAKEALRLEQQQRGWWPFAYTLLEELENEYAPEDEPLLERLYKSMAAGERSRKITHRDRFKELDAMLKSEVERRFDRTVVLRVHDAAASNGITSLDLFRLISENRAVEMWATDLFDVIWIVDSEVGPWRVVFDARGKALQVVGKRMVALCLPWANWRYPINWLVEIWAKNAIVPKAQRTLSKYLRAQGGNQDTRCAYGITQVRLVHPGCINELHANKGFHLERYDLTQRCLRQYHVVRVMNALTPSHLSEGDIRRGLANCLESLVPGGLLILGRSPEEDETSTRASMYEWDGRTLKPLVHLHGGYEWPEYVKVYR